MVWEDGSRFGFPRNTPAPGNYNDWRVRNRSFVAVKRPAPPRRVEAGDGKFALKDTTDPEMALKSREDTGRMRGVSIGANSGYGMGQAGDSGITPGATLRRAEKDVEDKPAAAPRPAVARQEAERRVTEDQRRRNTNSLLLPQRNTDSLNNPLAEGSVIGNPASSSRRPVRHRRSRGSSPRSIG
jgi:hypothetical protein